MTFRDRLLNNDILDIQQLKGQLARQADLLAKAEVFRISHRDETFTNNLLFTLEEALDLAAIEAEKDKARGR